MVTKKKQILQKTLLSLDIFFIVILMFQLTIAEDFSFSVGEIDRYLHFCSSITICIILLITLSYFFINKSRLGQRITIGLLSLPVIVFFMMSLLFLSAVIFANEKTTMKHYFFEKDDYKYFVTSERFWAFEGSSNLAYYKEKTIIGFIKYRPSVSYEDLESKGIDMKYVTDKFYEKFLK